MSLSYFNPSAHNYGSTSPFIQSHFQSDNATTFFNANVCCVNSTMPSAVTWLSANDSGANFSSISR